MKTALLCIRQGAGCPIAKLEKRKYPLACIRLGLPYNVFHSRVTVLTELSGLLYFEMGKGNTVHSRLSVRGLSSLRSIRIGSRDAKDK